MEKIIPTQVLPKIAASSYLNTAPLIWSFVRGSRQTLVQVVEAVPAKCAQLLSAGDVDAALVPVIEYQRIEGISLISNVCVGSKAEVLSVVLVSRCDALEEIQSIALDESSRTSAALVKIIFREFLAYEPRLKTYSPRLEEMLQEADAALIIGDPAMTFPRTQLHIWDMASLWRKYTGLGFVFAMWMVRNDALTRSSSVDFAGARDEGLLLIEEIVSFYERRIPLSSQQLRNYLTNNIAFSVDDSMQRGLKLYFELAHKHGLIEGVKTPRFYQG